MTRTMRLIAALLVMGTSLPLAWSDPEEPATVRLDRPGLVCEMTFEDGAKFTLTSEGARLKAGTYWLKSLRFLKKDDKGRLWELRSVGALRYMQVLIVDAGQDKIIQPGPPIRFAVGAQQGKGDQAGTVGLSVRAFGRYSEGYHLGATPVGKRPQPPAFRIVSESGKTLHAGKFDVIRGGAGTARWNLPRRFKGKYKIELQPYMGPFEWVTPQQTLEIK